VDRRSLATVGLKLAGIVSRGVTVVRSEVREVAASA
jgi:hypothetical protein